MALITENGWPQIPSSQLTRGFVKGLDGVQIELRAGDVYDILTAWMIWYDRNVEDIERNYRDGERDEWGWSRTNSVWNSNHLSGTAVDINATRWPMGSRNMPTDMVAKVREGLRLFEGTVFWGRDWNNPDEMHYQIQGNAQQIAPFAAKLRGGYLNLLGEGKPKDPNDFPLPQGYAYGPLDGPIWCISGEYDSDSQAAKDGLGRWQAAVGIPVTKRWDAATKAVATQLQLAKGWPPAGDLGHGLVFEGEWNAVMREGWRPTGTVEPYGVYWADVSVYQDNPATGHHDAVDESYPYRVFSFRVCTGDEIDAMADANYRAAQRLADDGKLDVIIPYFFWRPQPDHNTESTFRRWMDEHGWHDRVVVLADVESGRGSKLGEVKGDQSQAINGVLERLVSEKFDGDWRRVKGYHNAVADPGLWTTLPPQLMMIRPNYSIQPGKGTPAGAQFWAHQYTDKANVPPWGSDPTDMNFYPGTLSSFIESCGLGDDTEVHEIPSLPIPEVEQEDWAALIEKEFDA